MLLIYGLSSPITKFRTTFQKPIVTPWTPSYDSYSLGNKIDQIFPFQWADGIWEKGSWIPDVAYYDFTEFVVYVFTPLILAYAIWLFRKK